jgi:flavin-dependent dehydrogenase
MIETEVLIIGGGPSGSACAWRLKQHKIGFLLLDKQEFPRPKTCAGWITPRVMRDVDLDPATYPGNFTRFTQFKVEIGKLRFTLRTHQYAIRRVEFDAWLVQRVSENLVRHHAQEIHYENGRYIVDGEFSARYLIGAGGTHCPVKRTFFNEVNPAKSGSLIIAQEEEFVHPGASSTCHLWFFQDGLPGYAWYFPKSDRVVNVGVGGGSIGLKKQQDNLKRHWELLVDKLERYDLVRGHDFRPVGHSYYLRSSSPAIRSGINAADAIIHATAYTTRGLHRYSFPDLLGWRR